jgi:hypothetical protein
METQVPHQNFLLSPITVSNQSARRLSPYAQQSILSTVLDQGGVVSGRLKSKTVDRSTRTDIGKFTLQRWKEYALLRHGDNERFLKSPHGRRLIVADALRAYGNDVKSMVQYTNEVERVAKEVEERMIEEQEKRKVAEEMVIYKFHYSLCCKN